jgi:hypothetical protein
MPSVCECDNEPSGYVKAGNLLNSCGPVSFPGRTLLYGISLFIPKIVSDTYIVFYDYRKINFPFLTCVTSYDLQTKVIK